MAYFAPDNPAHLARVHASVREHPEFATMAKEVEEDILRLFQRVTDTGAEVTLRGYHEDPAEATNEAMRDALIAEVASVVSHRLQHYDRDPSLVSESRGRGDRARSVTYATGHAAGSSSMAWPPRALKRLLPYDTRRSVFHI